MKKEFTMKKTLFFLFLISLFLPVSTLQAKKPVPVQIPVEELTPDVADEIILEPNQGETEEKAHSILQNDPADSEEIESLPVEALVVEEIPASPLPATQKKPAASQPAAEEIPLPAPRPVAEEIPLPAPRRTMKEIPPANSGNEQPVRTSSGLIPFNPAGTTTNEPQYSEEEDYIVTDPANFLASVFRKHQFPYAFIKVEVLSSNVESRPLNNQFMQMNIPLMISFDTEAFAVFQSELEGTLEIISCSFQNEVAQQKHSRGRKMIREGVTLNIPDGTGNYKSYELPKECKEVLAQYAALLPVGKVSFHDGNENVLQNLFFPLLYRDIVKAFPINLLEVYQADYQTMRIFEFQEDSFMEFIQKEGKSFVIPEIFPAALAYSASAKFLERLAKTYYLEPVFRRPDPLPQIPVVLEMQLPMIQFQRIRFMNCEIMTDQPGETVAKSVGGSVIPENRQESVLTQTDVKPTRAQEKAVRKEMEQIILMEPAEEELPFILEEIPVQ